MGSPVYRASSSKGAPSSASASASASGSGFGFLLHFYIREQVRAPPPQVRAAWRAVGVPLRLGLDRCFGGLLFCNLFLYNLFLLFPSCLVAEEARPVRPPGS